MVKVLLYGLKSGCGLIVPYPSGIAYRNQVAGRLCRQHSLEGIFVPVDWDDAANAMEDVFFGDDILSPEDADRIDAKLTDRGARVDRSKLGESCEAWVWLTLDNGVRFIEDFACSEAVFTWENSD
jgi:hypothetical protein